MPYFSCSFILRLYFPINNELDIKILIREISESPLITRGLPVSVPAPRHGAGNPDPER